MEIKAEDHLKLVHKALTKFNTNRYEYEDLFQIGCIGLIRASRKFDADKKIKFSTFATTCIRNEILRLFQLDKWYVGTQQERLRGGGIGPVFLETEFSEDSNYYDFLKSDENVAEIAINKADADRFLSLNELTPREKRVIDLYYYKSYSTIEISKMLGYSHQTISNIKNAALKKMRQATLQS